MLALQSLGPAVVEAMLPTLVSVAADNSVEDLRVRQASVAEAVAGFMRGMSSSKAPGTGATGAGKRVTFTAEHAQPGHGEDPLWAKLLGVTATIVDTLSVAWCGDWAAAVRWVVCRRQPGAVAPLLRYMLASVTEALRDIHGSDIDDGSSGSAADASPSPAADAPAAGDATAGTSATPSSEGKAWSREDRFGMQTRWLRLLHPVLSELPAFLPGREAALQIGRDLMPVLMGLLRHRYQSCREQIGRTISMILYEAWAPPDAALASLYVATVRCWSRLALDADTRPLRWCAAAVGHARRDSETSRHTKPGAGSWSTPVSPRHLMLRRTLTFRPWTVLPLCRRNSVASIAQWKRCYAGWCVVPAPAALVCVVSDHADSVLQIHAATVADSVTSAETVVPMLPVVLKHQVRAVLRGRGCWQCGDVSRGRWGAVVVAERHRRRTVVTCQGCPVRSWVLAADHGRARGERRHVHTCGVLAGAVLALPCRGAVLLDLVQGTAPLPPSACR